MGFKPLYTAKPAMIPDSFMTFNGAVQIKGTLAQRASPKFSNTGWWQPSQDVRLSAGIALAYAQKKRSPGPQYLNITAPATTFTGSGGDDCA